MSATCGPFGKQATEPTGIPVWAAVCITLLPLLTFVAFLLGGH
jgi:hypothetical protein